VSAGVTAADRRRDSIALAILAAGAFVYLYAFIGMRALTTARLVSIFPHEQELRFNRLWELSRLGLLLGAVGALAMAWSYARYRMRPTEPR